ncbi:MAG: hypothetical protein ACKOWF_15585 [Chloroflexota bacterium]
MTLPATSAPDAADAGPAPAWPRMLGPLLGLKLFFAFCCAFIMLRMELPQFQGKAMWERMIGYPLLIAAIPVTWWLLRRSGRPAGGYPFAADFLLTLGIVLDLIGNIFNLFDSAPWYDDLMHLVNWGFYSAAFGSLLLRSRLGPWPLFGLVTGFGAITAILWEGVEWLGFIRFGTELDTAYFDTLLDEHLGLLGSAVSGLIVARIAARRAGALADGPSGEAA